MSRARKPEPPLRRGLKAVVLAYIVLAWVAPVLLLMFHQFSPLVLSQPMAVRLAWSAAGTALVVVLMVMADGPRFRKAIALNAERPLRHALLLAGGLCLFTWLAASLVANVLGPLSRLLPATPFEQEVVLSVADDSGWRFSHVELGYTDPADGRPRWLRLAKPHMSPSGYAAGQKLLLRGDEGPLGRYVTGISRLP